MGKGDRHMGILLETVRICGLRGLRNIEVNLGEITVLTGMNNSGKTSFLKALQIILGNRQFVTHDDFCVSDDESSDKIIIDVYIGPVDENGKTCDDFNEDWEALFTEDRIKIDTEGKSFIPLRTVVTYDTVKANYKFKQYILPDWPLFQDEDSVSWYDTTDGNERSFYYDEIPFFYVDAQRDIVEDIKIKSSYLGKMISKIEYNPDDIKEIEEQIKLLNERTVSKSSILTNLKTTLKELDTTMDTPNDGVEITPFTKKVRDLNKGLSIYYNDKQYSLPMEYHGMGTRSWSSLLTLKSFIGLLDKNAKVKETPFFPILAVEEPEAHLHPNAQKKLFGQINSIKGQKIISTHSPYIAACCELHQFRNFYKNDGSIDCGIINVQQLCSEDIRKIKRHVINTRGELFFSKAIVFFEGETEEQALPIFAEKYFDKNPIELGINFVGVGGYGKYLPFLRITDALKIPWFILSDGEEEAVKSIKKALKKLYNREIEIESESNIFILDDECDFERYLLEQNYIEEIKLTFCKMHSDDYLKEEIRKKDGTKRDRIKTEEICDKCSQNIYRDIFRDYCGDQGFKDALYDCMISQKAQFGPAIAEIIVEHGKNMPAKIIELFDEIKVTLYEG